MSHSGPPAVPFDPAEGDWATFLRYYYSSRSSGNREVTINS